jgi:hypothetical protein
MRKLSSKLLYGLVLLLGLHTNSWGIVINDTAGAGTALANGTPYTGVVEIFFGGFVCSGALISSTHVITAGHCSEDFAPGDATVNFHNNNDGAPELTRNVSAFAEFGTDGSLVDGTDITILTLASAVSTFPTMAFAGAGLVNVGDLVTTVGFGGQGVGSTGVTGGLATTRWAADNILDAVGAARCTTEGYCSGGIVTGSANILNTDFDDGSAGANTLATSGVASSATPLANEGTTAGGDSGGPLLINGLIAGVLSGGTTGNSVYGDISWWTGTYIATVRNWILSVTNNAAVFVDTITVPEPGTLSLLLLGLLGLGYARRQKLA